MDKINKSGISVLAQIVNLMDKRDVDAIAQKCGTDRYCKYLTSYTHLTILLRAVFGQLTSLRDIVNSQHDVAELNHFGVKYVVRRSTLSDANAKRDPSFFE